MIILNFLLTLVKHIWIYARQIILFADAGDGDGKMMKFMIIALGGGIGALLRYWISGLTYMFFDGIFPWGTMSVNIIGSFFIGFFWEMSEYIVTSVNLKTFLFIGVLGAFTTFSTYSLETVNLFRDGEMRLAISNMIFSNCVCIIAVFLGFIMTRYLVTFIK